jgi:adenylate cyclase
VTVQRGLQTYNLTGAGPVKIQVRIGLGAGEPLTDGDTLFGSTVNLTARICACAEPGQILAARVIPELCAGKSFGFKRYGEVNLKGFPDPVELYEVDWAE